jgi:hypothetical protein
MAARDAAQSLSAASDSGANSRITNLSSLLDVLQEEIDRDPEGGEEAKVSLEMIMDLIGRRAYGPILLVIGLLALSPLTVIPGATWLFAALTLAICFQMVLHKGHVWMPKKALSINVTEGKLTKFIKAARPTARFVDKFIRPRLTFLSQPPWAIGIAFICALAALISFPAGLLPFAPMPPALAIAFFGLGLTARDGVMLSLGSGIVGLAIWLLVAKLM